jgi:hypothetical protein
VSPEDSYLETVGTAQAGGTGTRKKKKKSLDKIKKRRRKKERKNLKTASQPLLDIYTTTPLRSKENKNGVCVAVLSAYYRPIKNGKLQKRERDSVC